MEFDYRASSLKKVEIDEDTEIVYSGHKPQVGDVVAVRITHVNEDYSELDLEGGELVQLQQGDVVLGVLGNRSGVKGYIGEVPDSLDKGGSIEFLGSGGIFGRYISGARELDQPCEAELLGYVSHNSTILNTRDFGTDHAREVEADADLVAVVASRMDAGKTTLASKLIEGLSQQYDIASLKLTGSARERDRLQMLEAGSKRSYDFVDAGLPSTVHDTDLVVSAARGLVNEVWDDDLDFVVVEFGAGLVSNYGVKEALRNLDIRDQIFGVSVVSLDVMGAHGLKDVLNDMDYEVDFVSGPITDTTVGRETVENQVGVPALNAFQEEHVDEAVEIISRSFEED